jgi:hypothetical protein
VLRSQILFLVTQSFKVRHLRHFSLSQTLYDSFCFSIPSSQSRATFLRQESYHFIFIHISPGISHNYENSNRFYTSFSSRPFPRNSLVSEYILLSQWLRGSHSRQSCAFCTRRVAVRATVARLRTATRSSGDSPDPIVVYIYFVSSFVVINCLLIVSI